MTTTTSTFPTPQDLDDLQGDVVIGIPKRHEDFLFYNIEDIAGFKRNLKLLIPAITTSADLKKTRADIHAHKSNGHEGLVKVVAINIGFSSPALKKLGLTESTQDSSFESGQLDRAKFLGDPPKHGLSTFLPDWDDAYLKEIDCIILVAGDCTVSVREGTAKIEHTLGHSVKRVHKVSGNARPGDERGHEHFGFKDGVSFPCIPGLNGPTLPGQQEVEPGVLICGQEGENPPQPRPSWTKNGSFLAFRQLQQLVPEFNKFLEDNPIPSDPDRKHGSELLGARFFGRWKSGAPTELAPLNDDPKLGDDKTKNNNFTFDDITDETKCPSSAHIRKTNPRSDLSDQDLNKHLMMRQGIPYGPEVTEGEKRNNKTDKDRGLAFACYQSNLEDGFEFVQQFWANNQSFRNDSTGFDPIIGQNFGQSREVFSTDPAASKCALTLPSDFVVPKGGAYFFVPSMTTLKTKIAT